MSVGKRVSRIDSDLFIQLTHNDEDDQEIDSSECRAWALCDLLSEVLPFDSERLARLPLGVRELVEGLPRLRGEPLKDVICGPQSQLRDLRAAKDHAKSIADGTITGAKREAARAVYYGAIAAALVYHDEKISRHTYEKLYGYFGCQMGKRWILPSLLHLFAQARDICDRKRCAATDDLGDRASP